MFVTGDSCPVCDACPQVLIAIAHPAMRRMILELLEREHGCWQPCLLDGDLPTAMRDLTPDLVIIDGAAFPQCCSGQSDDFPPERIVVVGPEPDPAYRILALSDRAGGWVARDDVAEELSAEMRTALGCIHKPCPPPNAVGGRKESVEHRIFNR